VLYGEIANLLAAAGRTKQAIEYYRLSLAQDPLQPDALRKLATLLGPSDESSALRRKAASLLPHPN